MAESDKENVIFGECKWTNTKADVGVLDTLVSRGALFNHSNKHYYLFAKSGFTQGCRDKAKELKNVTLVKLNEIIDLFQKQ